MRQFSIAATAAVLPFVFPFISFAESRISPEIEVRAERLRLEDEVFYSPQSVAVEKPATDEHLGRTLGKLPGVVARNHSGPGSLTTAIAPQALNASSTAVSIDGVPVPDPAGIGINFSLFPALLIEAVEYHSPFYPAMDATSVILPAPGGRIDLRTQGRLIGSGAEGSDFARKRDWSGSILMGSANTLEAGAVYRGKNSAADWEIGGGALSTRGDFPYRDPVSGIRRVRENNDAAGAGGLARYRRRVGGSGSVGFTALSSRLDRTNPGPLDFPSRDHERDTFHLLGASYFDSEAFSKDAGAFGKAAGTLSRVQNEISPLLRTDAHTFGGYAQAGTTWRHGLGESVFALDDLEERLNDGTGLYARNTAGLTHSTAFRAGGFRLIPLLRYENSSAFGGVADGSASIVHGESADGAVIALSLGFQHAYAPIPGVSGYNAGGIAVLPNAELKVERDAVAAFSVTMERERYSLYAQSFHDRVLNRAAFTSLSGAQARYQNVPSATVLGQTLDGRLFPRPELSLRASATVSRAWDRGSGHEFPYKPRVQGLIAAGWVFDSWIGVSAEEEFLGKRYVNLADDQTISPLSQTNLRVDARVTRTSGTAFFKISNVFDRPAFVSAGFPNSGRTFYLGCRF